MQYYVIPATGTGTTPSDSIRPNVSVSSWVGALDTTTNDFLIATNDAISSYAPLTTSELQIECTNRSLDYNQVLTWSAS